MLLTLGKPKVMYYDLLGDGLGDYKKINVKYFLVSPVNKSARGPSHQRHLPCLFCPLKANTSNL